MSSVYFNLAGGNFLHFGSSNLHADWDGIALDPVPTFEALCEARAVQPVTGALLDKPAKWASESVRSAKLDAFVRVSFGARSVTTSGPVWPVTFVDRSGYIAHRKEVQQARLIRASARLAEVLNGLWPGQPPAMACP